MPAADYLFEQVRVAIRGGGDLGSGVAYRLVRCGFPVLITELPRPLLLRRAVCFGSAALQGEITVEGLTARRVEDLEEGLRVQTYGEIPVLIDPRGDCLPGYNPSVLVDARMTKTGPDACPIRPPLLIGMGPGFHAPDNCDVVLETNRGHQLGRAIRDGSPQPDTGLPGGVLGHSGDRVLRAPVDGVVTSLVEIGDRLKQGQPVASVDGQVVSAPFDGVLRGLVHDGVEVRQGLKIGDVDPRGDPVNSVTISDKSLAIGGGAVEAVFSSPAIRRLIRGE